MSRLPSLRIFASTVRYVLRTITPDACQIHQVEVVRSYTYVRDRLDAGLAIRSSDADTQEQCSNVFLLLRSSVLAFCLVFAFPFYSWSSNMQ
jgi:hypothetical protein